jgi:hypothetical protein
MHYRFLYNELNRIVNTKESFGQTRVCFVSRQLRQNHINIDFDHVFLEFQRGVPPKRHNCHTSKLYVSEHAPYLTTVVETTQDSLYDWEMELSIQLPNIPYGLSEIKTKDLSLPSFYCPGIRDCRHHCIDMLKFCYPID